jgi:anti-sigma factor RsiW
LNINRHNYEEFFLLYVDGELNETQRREVESFVQHHADLAEELEMLQQSVLLPDEISFGQKEILFKTETSISINNYEEFFLLSVDQELTDTQRNEVERFVLQHPELQDAFTLLHETKLPIETVVFEDKASLYKSEERDRRIVPFTWLRMGAAAAVLAIIGALWFANRDGSSLTTKEVAAVQPATKAPSGGKVETKSSTRPVQVLAANKKAENNNANENNNRSNEAVATFVKKETTASATTPSKPREKNIIPPVNNSTPEKMFAVINKTPEDVITAPVDIVDRVDPRFVTNTTTAANSHVTTAQQPVVSQAAYKEIEDDENDRTLYIGSTEINKNKLKSIFKKASSLFQKKDRKNDEDQKTINIASFEFKSK